MLCNAKSLCRLSRRLRWLTFFLLLVCAFAGSGLAQPLKLPPVTAESLLADMWVRLAKASLSTEQASDEIAPAQLALAEVQLDLALELTPDDADIVALRITLAERSGDTAGVVAGLKRYLALRPDADAQRLRLTFLQLRESSTVDGRLTMLEDALQQAQRDRSISEAVRSRIASAAAIAAKELGDEARFLEHLKTAVRADPANGEAAALAYELALNRGASPLQRGATAVNLVRARPIDSNARLNLAEALAALGVYDRAAEQFGVATMLPRADTLPPEALATWTRCLIAQGEDAQAAELLDQITRLYEPREGDPQLDLGPLPHDFLLLRRVLAGEGDDGSAVYQRIVEQLQPRVDAGDADAMLDLAWIKALFGPDTEQVTALLAGQDQGDVRYQRATGFVFMREGADRWARQAFEGIAADDPIAAYGLAQLQGRDEAGTARYLREVVQQAPATFGGLLAARQLEQMRRILQPGPQAKALTDVMDRSPVGLWRFDVDRNPWINLRFEFAQLSSAFLEPIVLRVTLQNRLGVPLSFDAAQGIGTTAIVSVSPYAGGRPLGEVPPIVLDLARRLTLGANETLTFDLRLDRSPFGLLLASGQLPSIAYNAALLLDPRYAPNGTMTTGPLGAVESVRSVQAFVPALNPQTLESLAIAANGDDPLARFTALARIAQAGPSLTGAQMDAALARRCIDAVQQRYEAGNRLDQAWIMLHLNTGGNVARSEFRSILEQAQRSSDPLVKIAYLAQQVAQPTDTTLTNAIRDGSPRVKRFAENLQTTLQSGPRE